MTYAQSSDTPHVFVAQRALQALDSGRGRR